MKHFSIQIEIKAAPGRVWEVMSDVERWHEWTSSITSVEVLGAGPTGVGSWARIRQPKLPPVKWQVTEWSEGKGFTWVSRGPGLQVTGKHWIKPTATGSTVKLSVTYEGLFGALLAWLTGGINDRYLALEANGLKKRSETVAGGV